MATTGRDTPTEDASTKDEESAVLEERSLYQDLVDAQPGGIYRLRVRPPKSMTAESWRSVVDTSFSSDFISERFAEILGSTRDELQRNPGIIPDTVIEEDRPDFLARSLEAFATRAPFQWTGRITVRGETRWIRFSSRQRVLANGDVIRTGFVEDVTEAMRVQQALVEAEERFRTFFDLSSVGKVMTAPNGRLVRVNKALCDMLGYSAEELQSFTFASVTHPDDLPESVELVRSLLAGERGSVDVDKRYLTRDGRVVWAHVRVCLLRDAAGAPLHLITDIVDISDRKAAQEVLLESRETLRKSEETYRALFDNMLNGSAYCRMLFEGGRPVDWIYLNVNRAFEKQTGLVGVAGRRVSEVIPGLRETSPDIFEVFGRVALTGRPEQLETYVEKLKDWFSLSVYSPAKEYFVAVFDVITDRKATEQALRASHEVLEQRVGERTMELAEANRELEAFSYSVSHELRSPLRAIDGFSALIARAYGGLLDDEGRRLFGQVRWNAQRMGRLIDDLLAFARAGRSDLTFNMVDMTGFARTALAQVVPDPAALSRISFSVDALPDCTGDATLLQRVWENLLSNAVKFSAVRERPEIRVEGCVEEGEAIYRVRDNGVGFEMKYVDQLFGVFRRLQGTHAFEGTGVGLALVRRIITRHGGRVWAEGELDRGATFSFSLPVLPSK